MTTSTWPLFVCGGLYEEKRGEPKVFKFVSATPPSSSPYVTTEEFAWHLRRLTEHHSSMYQISADFTKLRKHPDHSHSKDPQTMDLTMEQQQELMLAADNLWKC